MPHSANDSTLLADKDTVKRTGQARFGVAVVTAMSSECPELLQVPEGRLYIFRFAPRTTRASFSVSSFRPPFVASSKTKSFMSRNMLNVFIPDAFLRAPFCLLSDGSKTCLKRTISHFTGAVVLELDEGDGKDGTEIYLRISARLTTHISLASRIRKTMKGMRI